VRVDAAAASVWNPFHIKKQRVILLLLLYPVQNASLSHTHTPPAAESYFFATMESSKKTPKTSERPPKKNKSATKSTEDKTRGGAASGGSDLLVRPPLVAAQEVWDRISSDQRTAQKAILLTAKACCNSRILTNDPDTYKGVKIIPGCPQIPQAALELFRYKKELEGEPVHEEELDEAFSSEFATNLLRAGSDFKLVTIKYLALAPLPSQEFALEEWSASPKPTSELVDFLWNAIHLGLCSLDDIRRFVDKDRQVTKDYLLSDESVKKLIKSGTHEDFTSDCMRTTTALAVEITETMQDIFGVKTVGDDDIFYI
jgi:hypothetical protein